jgi:hypothetical protein
VYRRLILQEVYPGGVCPAEHTLVAYHCGEMSRQQSSLLEAHLRECSSCREEYDSLARAEEWFRRNERRIVAGLAAKGAAAEVLPWSRCPSVGLLYRYVSNDLPDTTGGGLVRAQIQRHFVRCRQCVFLAEDFRSAMQGRRIALGDLAAQAGMAMLALGRELVDALLAAAEASGSPVMRRGAPGFRGEKTAVSVPVLGADGKVLVDDQGNVRQCRFELLQARIQTDGFLIVDLAADPKDLRSVGQELVASLQIIVADVALVMPETPVDENGRVTFTGVLPTTQTVGFLPVSCLDVVLRQTPSG